MWVISVSCSGHSPARNFRGHKGLAYGPRLVQYKACSGFFWCCGFGFLSGILYLLLTCTLAAGDNIVSMTPEHT